MLNAKRGAQDVQQAKADVEIASAKGGGPCWT